MRARVTEAVQNFLEPALQIGGARSIFLALQKLERVGDALIFRVAEIAGEILGGVRRVDRPQGDAVAGLGDLGQLLRNEPGVLERGADLCSRRIDHDGDIARLGGDRRQLCLHLKCEVQFALQGLVGQDGRVRESAERHLIVGRDPRVAGTPDRASQLGGLLLRGAGRVAPDDRAGEDRHQRERCASREDLAGGGHGPNSLNMSPILFDRLGAPGSERPV